MMRTCQCFRSSGYLQIYPVSTRWATDQLLDIDNLDLEAFVTRYATSSSIKDAGLLPILPEAV